MVANLENKLDPKLISLSDELSRIARVLFFLTLDESFALQSAVNLSSDHKSDDLSKTLKAVRQIFLNHKTKSHKLSPVYGYFKFPSGVDLSYWREFKLNTKPEFFEPVIYIYVGKFGITNVAHVLSVSEGTLKTRLNKGLLLLGDLLINKYRN